MPQITQLALEGRSCREIAKKVRVSKTAVNRWLHELRRQSAAQPSPRAADVTAKAASRYELIYRKAIEGFNASQVEKQIRIIEETETPGDDRGPKTKKTTRVETQAGNANLLGKAKDAVKAMEDLHRNRGPRGTAAAGPIDLAAVTDDDLDAMTELIGTTPNWCVS